MLTISIEDAAAAAVAFVRISRTVISSIYWNIT